MENVKAVKSQVTMIVRGMYSNPPNHGARTVSTILNNNELKQEWYVCNICILFLNLLALICSHFN